MARARNIKPGFFSNDDLAENNCPLGRILFIGLWCLADYKGDVEWRANRIKVQILPYDDCDIKQLAINLDLSGFVTFYSDGKKVYLRINNFDKHQNPHPNEKKKGSDIPEYSKDLRQLVDLKGLTINHDLSRQVSDDSITNRAESLIPHPDSLILNPEESAAKASPPAVIDPPKKSKRGTRLPDNWKLTEEYTRAAAELRPDLLPVLETVAGSFADHWHSKSGQGATKVEWLATWRNWLRNERNRGGNSNATSNRFNQPRENELRRIERESREVFAQCEAEEARERAMGSNEPAVWQQMGQSGGANTY